MKKLTIILLLLIPLAWALGQVTGPSSVSLPGGAFQTSYENVAGNVVSWYGWNLEQREYFGYPVRVAARVDSLWDRFARFRYITSYAGLCDTLYFTGPSYAAFWLPDSGSGTNGIPDSLFYVVPDSGGLAVGDEFTLSSVKVLPQDQYNFRLLFETDTVKGTASSISQPLWIGGGVAAMAFAYQARSDSSGVVYRTAYSNSYGGPFLYFMSSDTLADSTWTRARRAGAWNYRTVTASGIDALRWLVVERLGTAAADTLAIAGEEVYIRGK